MYGAVGLMHGILEGKKTPQVALGCWQNFSSMGLVISSVDTMQVIKFNVVEQ